MINEPLSKLVAESLDFVVPNLGEIEALLADKNLYREYGMALAWMQDYLLRYSNVMIHSRVEPQDSKRYIQEIIANDLMSPLVDNLVKNQALVLRLAEAAKANPESEHIQSFIDEFLDNMATWQGRLSEADRTRDRTIIDKYLSEKIAHLANNLKIAVAKLELLSHDEILAPED